MAGFTNQDLNLMFTTVVWENIKKTLITCSKAMKEESGVFPIKQTVQS